LTRKKILERTVDGLQKVYAVVDGLALGQGNKRSRNVAKGGHAGDLLGGPCPVPPFGAFLVTLVAFFHGMNRHLDRCYLDRSIAFPRWGAFFLDFFVFFVQSSLRFLVALSLSDPSRAFLSSTFSCSWTSSGDSQLTRSIPPQAGIRSGGHW
jgi:hypothetical protein